MALARAQYSIKQFALPPAANLDLLMRLHARNGRLNAGRHASNVVQRIFTGSKIEIGESANKS